MQELIDNLIAKAGISQDQAEKAIGAVKDFVKEKFPMLEGAVENMFGSKPAGDATAAAGETTSGGLGDIEAKAGEVFDSLKGKLGGLFGS